LAISFSVSCLIAYGDAATDSPASRVKVPEKASSFSSDPAGTV
jgi:hypothetical protein